MQGARARSATWQLGLQGPEELWGVLDLTLRRSKYEEVFHLPLLLSPQCSFSEKVPCVQARVSPFELLQPCPCTLGHLLQFGTHGRADA